MHNRLIFRYHRERARAESLLLRGCSSFGRDEPTHDEEASDGVTQEGR
jgi:hypothetical protein